MRQIEDIINRLTDMDCGWWPVLSLRPPKDRDIDNRVLLKMSPVFSGMGALIGILLIALRDMNSITVGEMAFIYLLCCIAFFVVYKFTFAYFWNRRARRLRNGQAQNHAAN